MRFHTVGQWARERQRLLTFVAGSCIVTVWTLLRFFTQRTIFDLVSQQVVVQQWLHGEMTATHLGQTAYIPKMLLLYLPLDTLPGSPRLKLILLTTAINVATFVLLGVVIEKILGEYRVRIGSAFYASLLWLSIIAGSVFWIEFANSRNIEVVGGVFLIYLGLRYLRQAGRRLAFGLTAFGALLFFSDPLQVYMSALPLLIYTLVLTIAKKQPIRRGVELGGLLVAAYLGAQLLFLAAGHWLHLSFHDTGSASVPVISVSWLLRSGAGAATSALSLIAGATDAGRIREAANLGLLLSGLGAVAYGVTRHRIPRSLLLLVSCVVIVDTIVYLASGQAIHGATTSRYLIMLAPALVLLFGTICLPLRGRRCLATIFVAVLGINIATLTGALATHWDTSFPKDAHITSAYHYLHANPNMRIYSSIDTVMPLLFLHNMPAGRALPVGCLRGKLVRTHFSMDHTFVSANTIPDTMAAIVLDGSTIANDPNVCDINSITSELGQPESLSRTDDGSVIMLYRQSAVVLPN